MGTSLWDKLVLPLLIGVASPIIVAALCFLSVRLWNCLVQRMTTQTTVGERDHDQPRPVSDAYDANALPDLEMGTINGGEGGESMTLPDLDVGMTNGGDNEVSRGAAAPVGQMGS